MPESHLPYVAAFPPGEVWIDGTFKEKIKPEILEFNNIENLLLNTVTSQIPKEVKWGCSLSGGVDSSLLCALAKSKGHSFNCYTLDTGGGPDLQAAKEVSRYLDLPLKLVKVTDIDIENAIPKIVRSLGTFQAELILGGLFTYFISREAYKDGLKVLLFGEGADEVFGGYDKYKSALEESSENTNNLMSVDLNALWLTHNKRVDHASMAASIEARVPYQDAYVTNNVAKLPLEMKVDERNLLKDKIALRGIAKRYLPDHIALRKKEVISRGTDLGFMMNKVSKKMASYYRVETISKSDRKDFKIESYIEAVAFKIWRNVFPNLAQNILSMKQRGLLKKIIH